MAANPQGNTIKPQGYGILNTLRVNETSTVTGFYTLRVKPWVEH